MRYFGFFSTEESQKEETKAFIVGSACDNIARVWDVAMGRVKHTFTGHIGKGSALFFSFRLLVLLQSFFLFVCALLIGFPKVYGGCFTADGSKVRIFESFCVFFKSVGKGGDWSA